MYIKRYIVQTGKQILIKWPRNILRFFDFLRNFSSFKKASDNRFTINLKDIYPCLSDKTDTTPFDTHYIYHPAWAARVLAKTKPAYHVDFSSILSFGSIVSAFVPIKFYDYRPAKLQLPNWESGFADLTKLSFEDNSIPSLSCMHTIEHVGLGRYGDALDPQGDVQAINELKRVLQRGGDLLFVTPVGKQKIEYNAHRIYSYKHVIELFSSMELKNFSLVDDQGNFIEDADPAIAEKQQYGCGCFWFKKL